MELEIAARPAPKLVAARPAAFPDRADFVREVTAPLSLRARLAPDPAIVPEAKPRRISRRATR